MNTPRELVRQNDPKEVMEQMVLLYGLRGTINKLVEALHKLQKENRVVNLGVVPDCHLSKGDLTTAIANLEDALY